jgi:hypothetical protein
LRNLFSRITSFSNLLAAARRAEKGKRYRPDVLAFNANLEPELFVRSLGGIGAYLCDVDDGASFMGFHGVGSVIRVRNWGDLDAEDRAVNDSDHTHAEGKLFSSYDTPEHGTIWVITEGLRGEGGGPITTVLFPEDY